MDDGRCCRASSEFDLADRQAHLRCPAGLGFSCSHHPSAILHQPSSMCHCCSPFQPILHERGCCVADAQFRFCYHSWSLGEKCGFTYLRREACGAQPHQNVVVWPRELEKEQLVAESATSEMGPAARGPDCSLCQHHAGCPHFSHDGHRRPVHVQNLHLRLF